MLPSGGTHGIALMAKPPTATAKASDTPMGVISDTPVGFASAWNGDARRGVSALLCVREVQAQNVTPSVLRAGSAR
jgi:hypothetical protein